MKIVAVAVHVTLCSAFICFWWLFIHWFTCVIHICSNVDGFGLEAEARMTTWHIMIPSDIEPDGVYNQDVSEGNLSDEYTDVC